VIVVSLNYRIHGLSSYIQSCPSPFEIVCRLQLEHKAATLALRQKEMEGDYLPPMPSLLTKT
jgi:hypothetical protein